MRYPNSPLWRIWQAGDFTGANKPRGVATVEPDYWLTDTFHTNGSPGHLGIWGKGPARWWARQDNDQHEEIIPGLRSIEGNVSLDQDAGTCTIVIANTVMDPDPARPDRLGQPGYLSPERGGLRVRPTRQNRRKPDYTPDTDEARARWGHTHNEWYGKLTEGALIRTYEGYFQGPLATLAQLRSAQLAGRMAISGTWLVDKVEETHAGDLKLTMRDMAKLLIEQTLTYPLVPAWQIPLRYVRWIIESKTTKNPGGFAQRRLVYKDSSGDRWYPSRVVPGRGAPIHGHYPADSIDGNSSTFWLSVGNSHGSRPFAYDWIEYDVGGAEINEIKGSTWGGGYEMFVSIKVNGVWQGTQTIPYNFSVLEAGQPGSVDTGADIPYLIKTGVSGASSTATNGIFAIRLGRTYKAQRIRITFHHHMKTRWGPWYYRAALRELKVGHGTTASTTISTTKKTGNYTDYTDIVKEILLWSGWYLLPPGVSGVHSVMNYPNPDKRPRVYGVLETTSAYADEQLPVEMFHEVSPMEAINALKAVVGYIFRIGCEGEVHFQSPNFWRSGNMDSQTGRRINFIPAIDERLTLLGYARTRTDEHARSEVTVATNEPLAGLAGTVQTTYYPPTRQVLRGMERPARWINGHFLKKDEQERMVELIALHIWFQMRAGSVTCRGNPLIEPDDQVRIWEETTGETNIHYVRAKSWRLDCETSQYTMTLTTNWLGTSDDNWVIRAGVDTPAPYRTYRVPDAYENWSRLLNRIEGRAAPQRFTVGQIRAANAGLLNEEGDIDFVEGMEIRY